MKILKIKKNREIENKTYFLIYLWNNGIVRGFLKHCFIYAFGVNYFCGYVNRLYTSVYVAENFNGNIIP